MVWVKTGFFGLVLLLGCIGLDSNRLKRLLDQFGLGPIKVGRTGLAVNNRVYNDFLFYLFIFCFCLWLNINNSMRCR